MPDSAVIRYLDKYSVKGIKLDWNPETEITTAVIIPAIEEYENIKTLLHSLIKNESIYFKNTLFIFVINNLPSSNLKIKKENIQSIKLLKSIVNKSAVDNFTWSIIDSRLKIGYIDASSRGNELPEDEGGVGLARKIGMDTALGIFDYSTKGREKILICLDADCTVKENYLTEIHKHFYKNNVKAASINFEHVITNSEADNSAIICYETFLRYYVGGLRYAGSYYAFHTIGSAMACNHEIYIKTEGMNKRKAAEDFYFLEKISKHTQISNIKSTTVYPSERQSWRVPFGTGQRVTRFHARTHDEYTLYNPQIFEILKQWLNIFHTGNILNSDNYLSLGKAVCAGLYEFLQFQHFGKDFTAILNSSKSEAQIRIQQLRWFDGFRTLKLIHFLRDHYLPNINMFDALDIMLLKLHISVPHKLTANIPGQEIRLKYLEILRLLDSNV